jgi:murein DD-endopeptidase MepM/ murein hydrolase activator NlpD
MRIFLSIVFLLYFSENFSQSKPYPKGYFRYPLDIPAKLNANFGEMRPNHFHMGLDLFTQRKENLPIYAAADGFVARIKIEPGGFGRAIYLNHPNGLTTLYAHMNDFMPDLEQYVRKKQYEQESWMQDLEIPAGKFPVKKGQIIGYSGNTGGSMGPHVHFEIRETASEKCLNPLLFGFSIPDNVPPALVRLAVYDRNQSTYEQFPSLHSLVKKGGIYQPTGTIRVNTDKIVLALQATDQMSGVPNPNGIFSVALFEGNKQLGGFAIDGVGYDETRYLNAHIDYRTKLSGGSYLQYVFPLDGDKLTIYQNKTSEKFIHLKDTLVHHFRLEVKDPYGNKSEARFSLQRSSRINSPKSKPGQLMLPDQINIYETDNIQVMIPEKGIYDSIYFTHSVRAKTASTGFSRIHDLQTYQVPVHNPFTIRLKTDSIIPYPLRDRILIRKVTKSETDVGKAKWELGWYAASFREFGSFQLISDDIPPQIGIQGVTDGANLSKATRIVVTATDNNEAIKNFRAELDGKWLMFSQKSRTFTYKIDEHCSPGNHTLKISVEDEAGNSTVKTVRFTR